MSENVVSIPIATPPKGVNRLASSGNLLAAWHFAGKAGGDSDKMYHLAIHFPVEGWRAYCWDEEYYGPVRVLPVSRNAVWIHTGFDYVMRLQCEAGGKAAITARTKANALIQADQNSCLIRTTTGELARLCLRENGQLQNEGALNINLDVLWAHSLQDGALALGFYDKLIVLSPPDKMLYEEEVAAHYCPLFIIHYDSDYLYYTEDPRTGWRKATIAKSGQDIRGSTHRRPLFLQLLMTHVVQLLISFMKQNPLLRCAAL